MNEFLQLFKISVWCEVHYDIYLHSFILEHGYVGTNIFSAVCNSSAKASE